MVKTKELNKEDLKEKAFIENKIYSKELNSSIQKCTACSGKGKIEGKICNVCLGMGEIFKGINYMHNFDETKGKYVKLSKLCKRFKAVYRAWTKTYR